MAPAVPYLIATHRSHEILPFAHQEPLPVIPVSEGLYVAGNHTELTLTLLTVPAVKREDLDDRWISNFTRGSEIDLKVGLQKLGFPFDDEDEEEDLCIMCIHKCDAKVPAEGEWLIAGLSNGDCVLVEVRTAKLIWMKQDIVVDKHYHHGEVVRVTRGIRGKFVTAHEHGEIVCWDIVEKKAYFLCRLRGRPTCLELCDDGKLVAVADGRGTFGVLDIEKGVFREIIRDGLEYGNVLCVKWNNHCREFVYGGENDRVVLRKESDGRRKDIFYFHKSHISDVLVVEGTIFSCGWDGKLVVWKSNGQGFLLYSLHNAVFQRLWFGGLHHDNLILFMTMAIDAQGKCLIFRFEIENWKQD